MNLTEKQQSVIDRMRDGWMLHIHGYFEPANTSKIRPTGANAKFVHHSTRVSLRDKNVIIHDFRSDHYYLTDAFK